MRLIGFRGRAASRVQADGHASFIVLPEDCCSTMSADWHNAAINYALQNVSVVTKADAVIKALG
jgi:nicotinamidase-related amidase